MALQSISYLIGQTLLKTSVKQRIGCEALIKRIVHDAVAANLTNAVMNSVNKMLSSLEEPEFAWTVPYHEMMHKSVRKGDTSWTDRDSEDQ